MTSSDSVSDSPPLGAVPSSAAPCRGSKICGSFAAPATTTDDVTVPRQCFAVFVRSPHAHARIVAIDASAARARRGVLAVLTGDDYVADGHIGMAHFPNPADANDVKIPTFTATPERKILDELQLPLAAGRVRFVGEAVAVVVAETLVAARDAAEAVTIEYDALPAVTDVEEALAEGAPALWPDAPDNLALDNAFGDHAAVEAAIAVAHLVVEQTIRSQRTASAFMEPRSAIGSYDAAESQYTLISGCQGVHRIRQPAGGLSQRAAGARARDLPRRRRRLRIAHQSLSGTGGVVWAARRLGRPVKWTGDRTEAFLTDYTARDVVTKARLAFDRKGRMLALALELTANTGAHTVSYVAAQQRLSGRPHCLRRADRLGAPARRDDQHSADGAVPRCGTAGSHRRHGAAHRHRGESGSRSTASSCVAAT